MNKELSSRLKSLNINVDDYQKVDEIFSDPATVMAIAETGKKIFDMFSKKKESNKEELKYLKKIYGEIRDMQNDLSLIINLLNDLKVYIDTTQIQYISNVLSSKINTTNLVLIGWLESGHGDLEGQFASIHEAKDLLGYYGFAHIHVYLLAFQKELDLCYWLKKGKNFRAALLQDSYKYLTDALNASHRLETPAKRLAAVNGVIADLEVRYKANTFSQDVNEKIPASNVCGTDGFRKYLYTLQVTGDLSLGFSFNITPKLLQVQPPQNESCRGGGDGIGGGTHKNAFDEIERKIFEVNSPAPNLDNIVGDYIRARELYLKSYLSKLELTAIINTINDLVKFIDKSIGIKDLEIE